MGVWQSMGWGTILYLSAITGINPEQWYIPARRISRANAGNFIRQDWLDALGMEKPTTVDELTAYLRAAKEAGLGGDSTVPFAFSIFESDPLFNVRRITDASAGNCLIGVYPCCSGGRARIACGYNPTGHDMNDCVLHWAGSWWYNGDDNIS